MQFLQRLQAKSRQSSTCLKDRFGIVFGVYAIIPVQRSKCRFSGFGVFLGNTILQRVRDGKFLVERVLTLTRVHPEKKCHFFFDFFRGSKKIHGSRMNLKKGKWPHKIYSLVRKKTRSQYHLAENLSATSALVS